jgi:acetyltransferase-like isoleucine patch superfamily enzyme
LTGISPLAYVSADAQVGEGVTIGEFTSVHGCTVIGPGTRIDSHCLLGRPLDTGEEPGPLVIGAGSLVRSHSTLYAGSSFAAGLATGHGIVARDGIRAGKYFQIGSATHLEGDSVFGDCVRTNTSVLLGRRTTVGSFVHIAPNVSTYNDPFPPSNVHLGISIGNLAVIGGSAILHPGSRIGFGAFVASGAVVRGDVADATCVSGDPATVFCTLRSFLSLEHRLRAPWPDHFRGRYPEEMQALLDALTRDLHACMNQPESAS